MVLAESWMVSQVPQSKSGHAAQTSPNWKV